MRILHHFCLCPFSRKVRVVLAEKKLEFTLEHSLVGSSPFSAHQVIGNGPVLVEEDGSSLADALAISEYLNECHPAPDLIGTQPLERAEVRRLVSWFDGKFNSEVTNRLVYEKISKRILNQGEPDSRAIRQGYAAIHDHLNYIGWLAERRTWLAGEYFSLADISAAAHLSTIDYLGDVPWHGHAVVKDWYARVKSRPSFRPLLADYVAGTLPATHYADLDF